MYYFNKLKKVNNPLIAYQQFKTNGTKFETALHLRLRHNCFTLHQVFSQDKKKIEGEATSHPSPTHNKTKHPSVGSLKCLLKRLLRSTAPHCLFQLDYYY